MARKSTALLATLGITAAVLALPSLFRKRGQRPASREEEDEFYEQQRTPSWAPPGWAFPVAWTLATVSLAAGTQRLLFAADKLTTTSRIAGKSDWQDSSRRQELLFYYGLHYLLYATFSRVYFDERSPVLAAAWTSADFALCHLAFYRAWNFDRQVAASFIPVNLWLTLAVPLSLYQAAANRDPIFGTAGIEAGEVVAASLGVTPVS